MFSNILESDRCCEKRNRSSVGVEEGRALQLSWRVRADLITSGTSLFRELWPLGEESATCFCLFLQNGSRRRTPGGVFLNLLKNTPSITEEQIKVKMIMFLSFKIHNNQTSAQPPTAFSTNLYQLLRLKSANFVTAPFRVKLVPFVSFASSFSSLSEPRSRFLFWQLFLIFQHVIIFVPSCNFY